MLTCLSDSSQSRSQWLSIWQRTGHEPFAHPDYLHLFASEQEEIQALYWQDQAGDYEILFPLIRRPLPEQLQHLAPNWTDAVSPYGYGGPFATPDANIPWERFWQDVLNWMATERVLTLFVRASLFQTPPSELALPPGRSFVPLHLNDNVVVDVRRHPDEQWGHYDHKVRKNVKKAQRGGLTVEVRPSYGSVSDFVDIYSSTMQRRSASGWYHFGQDFFQGFSDNLAENHIVAEVRDADGKLVSVELILKSQQFLYSFLGGTLQEAFAHAPNDLLKHAVIEYGYKNNLKGYVLGGGYQRNDGIFRYKRAFDSEGVSAFYGIQLVADQHLLGTLATAHHAQANKAEASVQADFFPAYRSPLLPHVETPYST